MPDPIFAHPRLAALYDVFDHPRPDLVPYVALAGELGAHHVLDVGCGTGVLAALLVAEGYEVTGADPALASLDVARARPGTSAVTWLPVEAAQLPALGCDLAVMTGNVAQVFVTDGDWDAALRGLARAVRPGGHLLFETRRPEAEDWRTWSGPPQVRTVPGEGTVRAEFELLAVSPPLVTFRTVFTFADGERLTSGSTLRFRGPAELSSSSSTTGSPWWRCGRRRTGRAWNTWSSPPGPRRSGGCGRSRHERAVTVSARAGRTRSP